MRGACFVTVYRIDDVLAFPPPEKAEPNGLLAVGGDLSARRLVLAYAMGIFPWYSEGSPILWFSPDPRGVLVPERILVSRSLRKRLLAPHFEVSLDTDFGGVLRHCAEVPRPGQQGTWITADMIEAYDRLFELGLAHSVEVRHQGRLVGGLYGVSLGSVFFGESMFALETDASKVALVWLVRQLALRGFKMIDCQVRNEHLRSMGAEEWPRERFLAVLANCLQTPTQAGPWRFDEGFHPVGEKGGEDCA